MNWSAVAAIVSLIGLIATSWGIAYTSGRFTQRIEGVEEKADAHTVRLDAHDTRLNVHDSRLSAIDEWKSGVTFGLHKGRNAN